MPLFAALNQSQPQKSKSSPILAAAWLLLAAALFFISSPALANQLKNVSLGSMDEYTRLVFTFDESIDDVVVRRDDVDTVLLDFGNHGDGGVTEGPVDDLITSVSVGKEGQRLTATVILDTVKFEVRHFLSRDRFSCVIDFKDLAEEPPSDPIDNYDQWDKRLIEPPSFQDVVRGLSLFIVDDSDEPDRLVQRALVDLSNGRLDEGIQKLEEFKSRYPDHIYADPAWFLLGDAYLAKGLPDNFIAATDAWRMALDTFPDSFTAPRAAFMMGEANRRMDYRNEAAGFYKLCAENYPESNFASLAILHAADMLLAMGQTDEARQVLSSLLPLGINNLYGRLALARSAMADYQDTLYSQSCETFREVLDADPSLFQLYPEMLYALGDSYSYLNRPDLTVLFLEHALNLMPDHPKTDVMLARIGNALQTMSRPTEAISYFNLAKDRYPDRDGGLVSQIRLADMGALRAFFSPEQVFDALDRGARQATVRMYDKILAEASESPLLQLAYLKIGQAQAADGENGEAIRWLRELVTKYPKGVLMDEAKPILSRAVINEAQKRFDLGQYGQVDRLNSENYSFLEGPDQLRFQRLLAESYDHLGQLDRALEVRKEIERNSPERRLADQMEVVEAALKARKPTDAFKQLKATLEEFPESREWVDEKIGQVGRALANNSIGGPVDELMAFRNDPLVLPLTEVSQTALMDAITILTDQRRYDQASDLMDTYRSQYPDDELSPEYLLTQSKIDRRLGRINRSWNRLSDFRVQYPDDPRGPKTIIDTIADARNSGRLPDAWRYEELYRQLYPDDVKGRKMVLDRAEELFNLGYEDEALATLAFFQSEYPGDPGAPSTFINQYNRLLADKRFGEAAQALDALRARYPDDPLTRESFVTQYRDLIRLRRPDEAFNLLSRFKANFPDDPRQPDLLLEEARDKFSLGRSQDGIAAWNDFLLLYPQDQRIPELTLLTARREIKEGMIDPAVEHYRQYLDRFPERSDRPQVLLELAAMESSYGLPGAAFDDLERFRRDFAGRPEEPQATIDQINLARSLNRPNDAFRLYGVFRSRFPNHEYFAQSFLDEIALCVSLNRIDDASALYGMFRQALPDNPYFPQSFLDQTRMEMAAGRPSRALATLESGIVQNPGLDDSKPVQDLLLSLYIDEGRVEDWAGAMEEFLGRDPNPQANLTDRFAKYSQVAQVYQELGRQQDAQRNFDLAMANRPADASGESLYTIADAYRRMGLEQPYRNVLEIMQGLSDPMWQNVANQELQNMG
jgi:tetratricopeptide (TPR) repeat protein